jgi:signal transduction histidine kinase
MPAHSAAARTQTVEAHHQALLNAIPDLMLRIRRDGTYLDCAGDLSRLATPADTLVGSSIHDLLPRDVAEALMACAEAALVSGELKTVEYRLRTVEDVERDFEARVVVCGPDQVLMIVRDVTDRKEAEAALRRSRARIVEAGENERRRLERNLHDGAQQRLVSVSHHVELARRRLDIDVESARSLLAAAAAQLGEAHEELRELARGIHPVALEQRGLRPALESLANRSPVPVELVDVPVERLPGSVEVALYYVAAEALTNVAKYAAASQATVTVRRGDDAVVAEIADDGAGGASLEGGTGLRGLADRVEALSGRLELESPAGGGTVVRAIVPLDPQA